MNAKKKPQKTSNFKIRKRINSGLEPFYCVGRYFVGFMKYLPNDVYFSKSSPFLKWAKNYNNWVKTQWNIEILDQNKENYS